MPASRSARRRKRLRRALTVGGAVAGVAAYRKRALDAHEEANAEKLGLDPDPANRPPATRAGRPRG